MLFRHHRVVELVVLVIELDDRARQLGTFLDAEPLRQRSGGDIAHHHLERNDLHLANQLLAHVEAADEMGRDTDVIQMLEQELRNPVVEDALALDHLVFLGIECGGVVLEVLDQGARFRSFIEDLGLAFVNATPTAHWDVPCVVEVHGWDRLRMKHDPRRSCRENRNSGNRTRTGPCRNLPDRPLRYNRRRPF